MTDGKTVLIDADLRPEMNHKGILCENSKGVWSVKCVNRQPIRNRELAGQICTLLGFSGYSFHNVSRVDENGQIKLRPGSIARNAPDFTSFAKHSWDHRRFKRTPKLKIPTDLKKNRNANMEEIVGAPQECLAMYVECVPHSTLPIDTLPDEKPPPKVTTEIPLPEPPAQPIAPIPVEPTKPTPPADPIEPTTVGPTEPTTFGPIEPTQVEPAHPIPVKPAENPPQPNPIEPEIQPDKTPTVIVHFEEKNNTNVHVIDDNFNAPWAASVFIDGDLACIGILLDRYWALVQSSCVEKAEYAI